MTQEEKAKAYDEVIKKAESLYKAAEPMSGCNVILETLFPELAESEDERIRKFLIKTFKTYQNPKTHLNPNNWEGMKISTILAWLEKQGEKPHVNKVEQKFCEGDWVIDKQGIVHQIAKVIENVIYHTYIYNIVGGGYFNDNTEGVRLWTIQDAKNGDVLACENGWTCIFKALVNDETFSSYCFMDNTKWFCETGSECHTLKEEFVKAYKGKIYPATKEQHDQLERAMTNAGYRWNKEELKLEKIEQKPAWSEEDKNFMSNTLSNLTELKDRYGEGYGNVGKCIDWLKSLKDRIRKCK